MLGLRWLRLRGLFRLGGSRWLRYRARLHAQTARRLGRLRLLGLRRLLLCGLICLGLGRRLRHRARLYAQPTWWLRWLRRLRSLGSGRRRRHWLGPRGLLLRWLQLRRIGLLGILALRRLRIRLLWITALGRHLRRYGRTRHL